MDKRYEQLKSQGPSIIVERQEKISIEKTADYYIRHTKRKVRELFTKSYHSKSVHIKPAIRTKVSCQTSNHTRNLDRTACELQALNSKIEYEIDKLKKFRNCLIDNGRLKRNAAMTNNATWREKLAANKVSMQLTTSSDELSIDKYSRTLKYICKSSDYSEDEQQMRPRLRTIGLKNAFFERPTRTSKKHKTSEMSATNLMTRKETVLKRCTDHKLKTKRSSSKVTSKDTKDRATGGCTFGHSVYQADYCPNTPNCCSNYNCGQYQSCSSSRNCGCQNYDCNNAPSTSRPCEVVVCCCPPTAQSPGSSNINAEDICQNVCQNIVGRNKPNYSSILDSTCRKQMEDNIVRHELKINCLALSQGREGSSGKKTPAKRPPSKSPTRPNKPKYPSTNNRPTKTKPGGTGVGGSGGGGGVGGGGAGSGVPGKKVQNTTSPNKLNQQNASKKPHQGNPNINSEQIGLPSGAPDNSLIENDKQKLYQEYLNKYGAENGGQIQSNGSKGTVGNNVGLENVKVGKTYTKLQATGHEFWDEREPCACIREERRRRRDPRYVDPPRIDWSQQTAEQNSRFEYENPHIVSSHTVPDESYRYFGPQQTQQIPNNWTEKDTQDTPTVSRYERELCACIIEERKRNNHDFNKPATQQATTTRRNPDETWSEKLTGAGYPVIEKETQVTPTVSRYERELCACVLEERRKRGLGYSSPQRPDERDLQIDVSSNQGYEDPWRQNQNACDLRHVEQQQVQYPVSVMEKDTQVTPTVSRYEKELCACIIEERRKRDPRYGSPQREDFLEVQPQDIPKPGYAHTWNQNQNQNENQIDSRNIEQQQHRQFPVEFVEREAQVTPTISRYAEEPCACIREERKKQAAMNSQTKLWNDKHVVSSPPTYKSVGTTSESGNEQQIISTPSTYRPMHQGMNNVEGAPSMHSTKYDLPQQEQSRPYQPIPTQGNPPHYAQSPLSGAPLQAQPSLEQTYPVLNSNQQTPQSTHRDISMHPPVPRLQLNSVPPAAQYESKTRLKELIHYERYETPPDHGYESRSPTSEYSPTQPTKREMLQPNLQDPHLQATPYFVQEISSGLQPKSQPPRRGMTKKIVNSIPEMLQPNLQGPHLQATPYFVQENSSEQQPKSRRGMNKKVVNSTPKAVYRPSPQQGLPLTMPQPMSNTERSQYRRDMRAMQQQYQEPDAYDLSCDEPPIQMPTPRFQSPIRDPGIVDSGTSISCSIKKVTTSKKSVPNMNNTYNSLPDCDSDLDTICSLLCNRPAMENFSARSEPNSRYVPRARSTPFENQQHGGRRASQSLSPTRSRPKQPPMSYSQLSLPSLGNDVHYSGQNQFTPNRQAMASAPYMHNDNTPSSSPPITVREVMMDPYSDDSTEYMPQPRQRPLTNTPIETPNQMPRGLDVMGQRSCPENCHNNMLKKIQEIRSRTHTQIDWSRSRSPGGMNISSFIPQSRAQWENELHWEDEDLLTTRTAASTSLTTRTCAETRWDDDFMTCDETEQCTDVDGMPLYTGCPCMYDTYLNMALKYKNKRKAKRTG